MNPGDNCTMNPGPVADDGYCGASSPQCPGENCSAAGSILLDDDCYLTFRTPTFSRTDTRPDGINSWGEFYAAYLRNTYDVNTFPEHNDDFPTIEVDDALEMVHDHPHEFDGVTFSPGCSN